MKLKQLTPLLMIPILSMFLTSCKKEETAVTYTNMPEVTAKYSNQEIVEFNNRRNQNQANRYENLVIPTGKLLDTPANMPTSLFYDSGIQIPYPKDGVKGIYLTADIIANKEKFQETIDFIKESGLNSVVIDFKDDSGQIITSVNSPNPLVMENVVNLVDLKSAIQKLEEYQIYPIARIVTFKDIFLATDHPELSFHSRSTGEIWADGNGAKFINPFLKKVWQYNIDVAIEAAKLGFKEIQYDYVRFPEGFETFADDLEFDKGDYTEYTKVENLEVEGEERVAAINDFLIETKEQLAPYGVKVGADVFGITAVTSGMTETTGIGQDFPKMAEVLDVISSMIYPSHWGLEFFGLTYPDMQPYNLVDEYMYSEENALKNVQNRVISRPWLQDFTHWDGIPGTFQEYGPLQVQDQINALAKHNIHEFLLWNANGDYSYGVEYATTSTSAAAPQGANEMPSEDGE